MDITNKRKLGVFYTPKQYTKLGQELLKNAIDKIPNENDYIILDRCAGTGNLLRGLNDEILSHYIISTFQYNEYLSLKENFGHKVRYLVPPTKENCENTGLITANNALSEEFIDNKEIMKYVNDPKCNVIIFENPPYADTSSMENQKAKTSKANWKDCKAVEDMKKELNGKATNEMANVFIWTAQHYYMKKPEDSLIVYAPLKYFKINHILNLEFNRGFIVNRRHFNTTSDVGLGLIHWNNIPSEIETINLQVVDIKQNELVYGNKVQVKKVHKTVAESYYDKRKFEDDITYKANDPRGTWCGLNGYINSTGTIRTNTIENKNIIGYMCTSTSSIDNAGFYNIYSTTKYDGHGCFLRKDNYKEKLPTFSACQVSNFIKGIDIKGVIIASGDGLEEYTRDIKNGELTQWLLKNLLFCCATDRLKMVSFTAPNGSKFNNQLCLDGDTIASRDLKNLTLEQEEVEILRMIDELYLNIKKEENKNYGIYQITMEFKGDKNIDEILKRLKEKTKKYYIKNILPVLKKYEFLK